MILASLINQIVGTLWFLLPIFILAALFKSSWFKGVMGEFIVNIAAKLMLDKNEYHLIKNVTLPTDDGTTQIDHIIVSKYGVFVVETKNMKGWIFGGSNQSTWTQKIFKHSSKFQNPLYQNYKHVKTLESLLGLSDQQIHSLIVFVGESTFKTVMPANVTHGIGYIRFIKSKTTPVLSAGEVNNIVSKIASGRLTPSFKTSREHVAHVKSIVSEKQSTTGCPKCGSVMVMREANKGANKGNKFLGCSQYPQCRGVLSVA
ncbi:MAG: NERD domain-containing protein [Desulfuromonadaceae bacterium]